MNNTNETVVSHRYKTGDQVFVKNANGVNKCCIAYVTATIDGEHVGVSYMYTAPDHSRQSAPSSLVYRTAEEAFTQNIGESHEQH
jgi:hypothetical protein